VRVTEWIIAEIGQPAMRKGRRKIKSNSNARTLERRRLQSLAQIFYRYFLAFLFDLCVLRA
jgi:hypothetical protein